jgi:hypothetical protein
MLKLLYPREKASGIQLDRRVVEPQSWPGGCGKEKDS